MKYLAILGICNFQKNWKNSFANCENVLQIANIFANKSRTFFLAPSAFMFFCLKISCCLGLLKYFCVYLVLSPLFCLLLHKGFSWHSCICLTWATTFQKKFFFFHTCDLELLAGWISLSWSCAILNIALSQMFYLVPWESEIAGCNCILTLHIAFFHCSVNYHSISKIKLWKVHSFFIGSAF